MRAILDWYQSGGPFILPLLLVGFAGLLLLAERIVFLVVQSKIHVRPFMEKVISLVRADKVDEALKLCAEHQSALPDLGLVILRSRGHDEADLMHVAKTATLTVVPGLTSRLAWLPTLAIVAVLLGILGATANLHEALTRSADPLRIGIAYALRPFGVGVLMAIPLVAGYAYLVHESEKLVASLEEFSARLVNALIDRPDVRLGHRN
jgi:biopolymer transport protein ExbB